VSSTCRKENAVALSVASSATDFYVEALARLREAGVPFLVGGTFAFERYTHIARETKDLDVFMRPQDVPDALALFADAGYHTELTFPHWLGKVCRGAHFIDFIFSSGNGVARVDDLWFAHAVTADVLGMPMQLCPAEEMIWSKAYVQERERFDGADVLHLLRQCSGSLDWKRLLMRFGEHWRVLLGHIVLFGFVYPDQRDAVPSWVTEALMRSLASDRVEPQAGMCNGTLLSREQYLHDLQHFGYGDPRVEPSGHMTSEEAAIWTAAIRPHTD
jgi:hypothetical protein